MSFATVAAGGANGEAQGIDGEGPRTEMKIQVMGLMVAGKGEKVEEADGRKKRM